MSSWYKLQRDSNSQLIYAVRRNPLPILSLHLRCLTGFLICLCRYQTFWENSSHLFHPYFPRVFIRNKLPSFFPLRYWHVVNSTSWKFDLYFVYIFITDWDFLTYFYSSDPSFNRNILTSLYLKSEISAHAQLCDYLFIHTIYKFHDIVSVRDLHWGYFFINGVYR